MVSFIQKSNGDGEFTINVVFFGQFYSFSQASRTRRVAI